MAHEPEESKLVVIEGKHAGSPRRAAPPGGSNMETLSPIARETLQEQAYNKLRHALMSGHFTPGQSITLRATAEAFGTSPMPVRDALRRLQIEHALVARPNRSLGVPEMTYASLSELREVRMALEGLATEKAAHLITPEEVATVESHYHAMGMAASAGNPAEYMRANWSFHAAIYRASRSQLLVSLIEPTWMRIGPYVRLMLPDRKSLIDSLDNHVSALQALQRHDGATARESIQRDIFESAEGLAAMLRAREEAVAAQSATAATGNGGRLRPPPKQRQGRR